ncbi:MAG: hypothetical protein ACT4TC_03725 [Myxococcaceae bacterium]
MAKTPKAESLPVRLTKVERTKLARAAEQAHLPLSTWVRQKALEAAEAEKGAEDRRDRVVEFMARLRAGKVKGAKAHAKAVERSRSQGRQR